MDGDSIFVGASTRAFGSPHARPGRWRRAALVAAEAELERYFEESLELLWTADLTGRLLRVNPAWKRCLGHPPEAMCGRPLTEFIDPRDRDSAAAEMLSLADGSRASITVSSRYGTLEGSHVWLEWSARSSPADGMIHGFAHDISPQRRAEQERNSEAKRLEGMVDDRTRDLNEARSETLQLLAVAGEYRDDETSQHTERVGTMSAEIGQRMGLSDESVALLREAAPLHDIGKLAIPDSVLLKPGRLTEQEQELMQTHTALGARLLFGSRSPALQLAGIVAEAHHEWWDGGGYPLGLIGGDIPLVGRIVAVADVFDALTHDRPYKPAWPADQAIALIRSSAASQFDPRVVEAFLTIVSERGPGETAAASAPAVRLRDCDGTGPSEGPQPESTSPPRTARRPALGAR
ncbi:MAG: domain S-box protein [Solirubrobacterales bacterium]|nr:domain S-box protein [Solirubrobacterales bacterium]